jgi:hypothetical protein
MAQQFAGSTRRTPRGRTPVAAEVEQLAVQMAEEHPTWGDRHIQEALAHLGYHIDKLTVRNILRRRHLDPAPQRRQAGMRWAPFLKLH